MSVGTRTVQNVIDIMRVGLGRRNANDPDSTDSVFLRYLNDFVSTIMPNDTKLFESFGTMSFTISDTLTPEHPVNNGVYTFNEVQAATDPQFMNISQEAYISLLDPVANSVSWNQIPIYQDPGEFFAIWGINNEEILIPGYPTALLFFDNEFTFRTIPNTSYLVKIYGYKKNSNYPLDDSGNEDFGQNIQFDYWLRYIAYGAMCNYARDFRYEAQTKAQIIAQENRQRIARLIVAPENNTFRRMQLNRTLLNRVTQKPQFLVKLPRFLVIEPIVSQRLKRHIFNGNFWPCRFT